MTSVSCMLTIGLQYCCESRLNQKEEKIKIKLEKIINLKHLFGIALLLSR